MKTCFKCLCEKPLTDFYKHSMMADGHLNKCRECTKRDVMRHRELNLSQVRAYDRMRGSEPHRLQANRERAKTEHGRALSREAKRAYRQRFYERARAHTALKNAVRDGRVSRLPCLVCGAANVEGHHVSYDLPLDVVWLCQEHHRQTHKEHRERLRQEHL